MAAFLAEAAGHIDTPAIEMPWSGHDGQHVVFVEVEGAGTSSALSRLRDLARNFGLHTEAAVSKDRSGLLVGTAFPTLSFCWEGHPNEEGISGDGLWNVPFADLGDLEAVRGDGDRVMLTLREEASRRIDAQSAAHGHRRFQIRLHGLAGAESRSYVWVPGMRTIPDVPGNFAFSGDGTGRGTVTVQELAARFAGRVAAREQLAGAMGIEADFIGRAPLATPRFREPLMLWALAPEHSVNRLPVYARWQTRDASARWLSVADAEHPNNWLALRRPWQLKRAEGASGAVQVAAGESEGPGVEAALAFFRAHVGGRAAVLLEGQVVGVVDIRHGNDTVLPVVEGDVHVLNDAVARWQSAYGTLPAEETVADGESPEAENARAAAESDFFQVRLMAEPQDRELIPVTHFSAPGAAAGVLVAVQNDVILDSRAVTDARVEEDADRVYMHLSLTEEGRNALADACFTNLGKQLAIVFEDELLCAPTIMDWEQEELTFKGMNHDWPEVAAAMARRLGSG